MILLWFTAVSQTFALPPGLLSGLCFVESQHNVQAINYQDGGSRSNGICQVKMGTARLVGYTGTEAQLVEPRTNMYYAAAYLRKNLDRYHGDVEKAVSAYNAGTHRVNAYGQTLNRQYVAKVMRAWEEGR